MAAKKRDEAHLGKRVKGVVYLKDNGLVPYTRKDQGTKQAKHGFGFITSKKGGK